MVKFGFVTCLCIGYCHDRSLFSYWSCFSVSGFPVWYPGPAPVGHNYCRHWPPSHSYWWNLNFRCSGLCYCSGIGCCAATASADRRNRLWVLRHFCGSYRGFPCPCCYLFLGVRGKQKLLLERSVFSRRGFYIVHLDFPPFFASRLIVFIFNWAWAINFPFLKFSGYEEIPWTLLGTGIGRSVSESLSTFSRENTFVLYILLENLV